MRPFHHHLTQITESSIDRHLHGTTHAPDEAVASLTHGINHVAKFEIHAPRVERTVAARRRRPVVGQLDVGKDVDWDKGRWQGRINQTYQLHYRGQSPAARAAHDLIGTEAGR